MFSTPPYTDCPANRWTTIFRGPALPFGLINAGEQDIHHPRFQYRVCSVCPPYYYTGSTTGNVGIPVGATPWAELTVYPEADCHLLATAY